MSPAANLHQAPGAAAAASATRFSGTLLDVMKCSGTRNRMLIMVVIWFNCAIVYYGINLNVVNIGFDLYLSVFTNGLVEIPAYAITALLLQRLGRRKLLVASMLLPGVCCIMGSLLSVHEQLQVVSHANNLEGTPATSAAFGSHESKTFSQSRMEDAASSFFAASVESIGRLYSYDQSSNSLFSSSSTSSWTLNWVGFARLLCGVIGIFGIAGAYNLIYIYTLELFPTVVRNAALGLATQAAGIGAVIAPTIVALDHYNSAIPFGLFAAAALVGALLALWLPETLNQPLWETLQGMENASTL
jgi:MFS family permease